MRRGVALAVISGLILGSACTDSAPPAPGGHPAGSPGPSNDAGRTSDGTGGSGNSSKAGQTSTGATAGAGARTSGGSNAGSAGAKTHPGDPAGDDDDDDVPPGGAETGGTAAHPGSGGASTATAGESPGGEAGAAHDSGEGGALHVGGTGGASNAPGGSTANGGTSAGTGGSSGTAGAETGGHGGDSAGTAGSGGSAGTAGSAGTGGVAGTGTVNAGGSGSVGTTNGQGPDCTDELALPLFNKEPATLVETGLYTTSGAAPNDVAPYVAPYVPKYVLWSDGAEKTRYAYIPRCSQIDASDMDHWQFPVGTRFWKEFRVPEAGGALVETRFIHRYGPGPNDWIFAAYQWPENPQHASDATYVATPVPDASGTTHDIPGPDDCTRCHTHEPERVLGFGAIELSHSLGGVTIRSLSDNGWLSPPTTSQFSPPGNTTAQAALGYLHTNCGPCHNENFAVGGDTPPRMRLSVLNAALEDTGFYQTLLDVPTYNPDFAGIARVEPCDAANSEIILRMSSRPVNQMPPFATEIADQNGIALVSAFIGELPAPGGTCP